MEQFTHALIQQHWRHYGEQVHNSRTLKLGEHNNMGEHMLLRRGGEAWMIGPTGLVVGMGPTTFTKLGELILLKK